MAMDETEKGPSAPTGAGSAPFSLDADRPVQRTADDLFRRAGFATALARHVGSVPDGQSLVFSLVGAWGAGKTSVLHMAEEHLREKGVEVIWFNPWLFSGTEQIASQFMRELGVHLGSKASNFGKIGEHIETYGRLLELGGSVFSLSSLAAGLPPWSAIPGLAGAGLSRAIGNAFKSVPRESVQDTRARVEKALRDAGRRIVVFVDDIDRLDGDEIRLVFKVVRLVADFPNVSYVLAFDRSRVERALGTRDLKGRAYLAKIVQASFDLPPLDPEILGSLLPRELARCIAERTHGPFHEKDWQDIFVRVVRPLVKYPRDVRRYMNAVVPAVDMLGEEVALEDVLALEAVRVFLPDVYDGLVEYADVLAMGQYGFRPDRHDDQNDAATARVKAFLRLGGKAHEGVVSDLCKFVFPMSRFAIDNLSFEGSSLRRWRRERRVACAEVLSVYLERAVREGATRAPLLRRLVESFDDEHAVDGILKDLSPDELEGTLGRLEDHADELAKCAFENGCVAVLRHADKLRQGRAHPFDFGAGMVVSRLILWTLRAVKDQSRRLEALKSIIARAPSLSWKAEVVRLAQRHKDNEPLIDEGVAKAILEELRSEVLGSSPDRFITEREPYLVVRMAHVPATDTFDARLRAFLAHPGFVRAMLASLLSEHMSWGMDSVAVTVKPSLPWSSLKKVAGGEDALRALLRAAVAAGPAAEGDERMAKALEMAQDVVSGRKQMVGPEERAFDDADDD